MNYSFSLARRSDTPEILKLYSSLVRMPDTIWYADYINREVVENDINNESLYVILDKNHSIMAVAAVCEKSDFIKFTSDVENMYYLERFAVLSEMRNKGIGSMLLRKIISATRRKGIRGLIAFSYNNDRVTKKLYQNIGFNLYGEINRAGDSCQCYELLF